MPRFCVDTLIQVVCIVGDTHQTAPQDYIVDTMASENSQPGADRKGIDFRVHVQIPWNAPESVGTLDSPGVVVLDTTCVPDVLGLRTRYADAETVRVLPGRARENVRVFIPDTNVADHGFHDVTLLDMAETVGPAVLMGDLSLLRRQWPLLVLSSMSRKQTDLELLRHASKHRFHGARTGCGPYCGTNIKHDMARHIASFHLDLAQLWRCPVSWCTQWKATPQDCIDHIRKKHSVPDSVQVANLGRWFPPWTVTRVVWNKALKPQVSGVSTDVVLFSEYGSSLVHLYRVFGRQSAAHASLRGTFMTKLRVFTIRADAEAKWEAGCALNKMTWLLLSSDSPAPLYRSVLPRGSVDSPACKAHRAVSPVIPEVSTRTASSTIISSVTSYAGTATSDNSPVPKPYSVLYNGRPPILPVSILLPRFADKNFVPSPVQSLVVATQQYPSSPDSCASTACVDLDAFE